MPVLILILLGVVLLGALFVGFGSLGPFLAVRRFYGATTTPIAALAKGTEVSLRGTIAAARRAPSYPRLTPGEVVFSELEVVEQVGKQRNVAFKGRNGQLFSLRDEAGGSVDADPRSAELLDAHQTGARLTKTDPVFQNWVARQGRFRWQKTPATCQEVSLRVGDPVMIQGQVILPLPGEMKEGDTELRVLVKRVSLLAASPWKGGNGRAVVGSLIALAVSSIGIVGCALWAGWL